MTHLALGLAQLQSRLSEALTLALDGEDRERGDVPGWVLITLMTAGLVTVLWALAGTALTGLFSDAINGVTGPGG